MNYFAIPGLKDANKIDITRNIIFHCSHAFDCRMRDLFDHIRVRNIVNARFMAMWLMRKHTMMTLKDIGAVFGRDHTSVIAAITRCSGLLETDELFRNIYLTIQSKL